MTKHVGLGYMILVRARIMYVYQYVKWTMRVNEFMNHDIFCIIVSPSWMLYKMLHWLANSEKHYLFAHHVGLWYP